jgi:hypothetical protein
MAVGGVALGAAPASAKIVDPPGYFHIWNYGSGKCIDGGPPVQWRCLNTSFEEWTYIDVSNDNWEIVNQATGKCLTQTASHENGNPVVELPCGEFATQLWFVDYPGPSDRFWPDAPLLNLSSGQCLDLENGDTSDGVPMQMWDCNPNTANQRWHVAYGPI